MNKIKVAVLEDESTFLKEIVRSLRSIETVDVVAYAQNTEDFIQKVRDHTPDMLILDIYLQNESITGIHIAELFQIPVLFFSSERKNYLADLDLLKLKNKFPVESIGKTFDLEQLKKILEIFLPRIIEFKKGQKVKVKPRNSPEIYINPADVSFILFENRNHTIYFCNRKPIVIADKNYEHFVENGFPKDKFYRFARELLLNIALTTNNGDHLFTPYMNDEGTKKPQKLTVTPDKKKAVNDIFK
jgi:chemotaxis response regulator CheB